MKKLIPPDRERCQYNRLEGAWPDAKHFMIIGPRRLVRCRNKPIAIVKENKPGKDGRKGSMSLCSEHLSDAHNTFPKDHFTETQIKWTSQSKKKK